MDRTNTTPVLVSRRLPIAHGDRAAGWRMVDRRPEFTSWYHAASGVGACSSVDEVEPGRREWHVSVSVAKGLPSDEQMRMVREAFAMQDAEEDNHAALRARHLWLRVGGGK